MNDLLKILADYGLPGIIIAVLFYQNFFLVRKVMSVIENNTVAMTQLKDNCKNKIG